jgi:hypothetical protein
MATYEENLAQMSQPYDFAPLPIRGGGQGRAFSGLLGDIFGGGGVSGLEEYLTPAQTEQMNRQALLQAAIAASQASGPSTTPRSFMQILGAGLAGGQQGYQQAQQGAMAQLLTKQKLDEYKMAQDQRRRLEQIFGAQASTGGMPMTPEQALAAPVGRVGPTNERAAMIGQVSENAAMSPEDIRYDQFMKAAQLFAADPTKSRAYFDMAMAIKPKAEVIGDIFTAKDGTQFQRTKTGQFLRIPIGIEFAQETVGEPFKAADGNFYLRTKTGGSVPFEQGLAAKPVGQPQQVLGADKRPMLVQMYDDGTYKPVTGVSPLIPPEKVDFGGGVQFVDPYTIKPGTVISKTMPPQVVGSAEGGYYILGGGGGRGGMPTVPQAAPAPQVPQAFPTRGRPAPVAAPVAPAAAGPVPIIPGTGKAPPADFLTKSYGIQNTNDAVNNFIGVVSKFQSSDMVDPTRRSELSSAHARAMLYAKELFNLGVLNAGDEVVLNKVLMNPVDFSSAAVPIEAVRKQADDLQKVVQSSASNLSKTYKQPTIELNKYVPPKAQGLTEGAESVSKSGRPVVVRNGEWEYK